MQSHAIGAKYLRTLPGGCGFYLAINPFEAEIRFPNLHGVHSPREVRIYRSGSRNVI